MNVGLVIHGIIASLLLLFLPLVFMLLFVSVGAKNLAIYSTSFLITLAIGAVVGGTAAGASKVWRRVLLIGAAIIFVSPVASCVGGAVSASEMKDTTASGIFAVGWGISSIFLGFFTTIVAVVYLVAGLLTGRDQTAK
jgi:hypothetical protein